MGPLLDPVPALFFPGDQSLHFRPDNGAAVGIVALFRLAPLRPGLTSRQALADQRPMLNETCGAGVGPKQARCQSWHIEMCVEWRRVC